MGQLMANNSCPEPTEDCCHAGKGCRHATYSEGCRIEVLLKRGLSKREIAWEPGRDASKVSCATLRNCGQSGTGTGRPGIGRFRSNRRRLRCRARGRLSTGRLWRPSGGRMESRTDCEAIPPVCEVMADREWCYQYVRAVIHTGTCPDAAGMGIGPRPPRGDGRRPSPGPACSGNLAFHGCELSRGRSYPDSGRLPGKLASRDVSGHRSLDLASFVVG